MLFLCKCLSPDTSGICGYSEPRRSQKEAESSDDEAGASPLCWELPWTSGQQTGTFWKETLQPNVPFAWTCFATSSTDEWSEDNTRAFLWEVSPEGTKAVGGGKLRLGDQQALGYI